MNLFRGKETMVTQGRPPNYRDHSGFTKFWFPFIAAVIFFALFAWVASCAQGQQPNPYTRNELLDQIQELRKQQDEALAASEAKLVTANSNVDRLQTELNAAKTQVTKVATERDGWKDYGTDQHDKWMNAEKRVAEKESAILRRNIVIGVMGLLIAAYLALKLFIKPPWLPI
jgi:hypothetical protein